MHLFNRNNQWVHNRLYVCDWYRNNRPFEVFMTSILDLVLDDVEASIFIYAVKFFHWVLYDHLSFPRHIWNLRFF